MRQGRVTLSQEELKRVKVLERLSSGCMTNEEAASILGVTCRQLRRLKSKYNKRGEEGLIHGNRGRKPSHALTEELKTEVLRLYREKYYDCNFCHLAELLSENDRIHLSPASVRRILKSAGHESKRKRRSAVKKHRPRDRRPLAGMLWQTDATPYEWLGAASEKFALHAAIDDATGIVVGAYFTSHECAEGYIKVMQEGIQTYGVPLALYSDKHTIFRSPKEKLTIEQELNGEQVPLSNFGKALAELGITHIKAGTPQAKGRVERLWETLQDRLPAELRLMGVKNIEEANKALPELISRHNRKYSVAPSREEAAYTPLEEGVRLDYVFAVRTVRKIGGGDTISYKNALYVPVGSESCSFNRKTVVEVRETLAGEVLIWHERRAIALRRIKRPEAAEQAEKKFKTSGEPLTKYKPAPDHPWRRGPKSKRANPGAGTASVA